MLKDYIYIFIYTVYKYYKKLQYKQTEKFLTLNHFYNVIILSIYHSNRTRNLFNNEIIALIPIW